VKIAYLSSGESIHDYRFLSKMIQYGHKPFLISYFGTDLVQVKGVKTYHFDYRKLYGFNRYINYMLDFQAVKKIYTFQVAYHLKKLLRKLKPDILHTNFIHYEGFCGALTGFRPTISMPWGTDILINPERSSFHKFAAKVTLKKANMIVYDSDIVRQKIVKLINCPNDKMIKVLCGVDLNIFNTSISGNEIRERLRLHGKKVLIMNRNFRSVYGIEYFIESLPIVIKRIPNVFVILIGEGSTKHYCQKKIEKLGLKDYVYFAGAVDETEMAKYLNAADIYVSTSLSDGTSVSLLEAFACALPVVVTDIPANKEWVKDGDNGFLVPVKNSEETANAILKLLKNNQIADIFAENNLRKAKEKADWDKQFQKLNEIYIRLVHEHP